MRKIFSIMIGKNKYFLFLSVFSLLVFIYSPSYGIEVFMNFDGDASFPSITVDHDTTGLADFSGSAFGYSTPTEETQLENLIFSYVTNDYDPFNIDFVTTMPAGTLGVDWKYWGIDDSAYTFDNVGDDDARLFGKANAFGGEYARTWAGSFALTTFNQPYGGTALSSPALSSSSNTMEQIAQALANNAAHEIAHLFGVEHEGLDAGDPSLPWNLMETNIESIMISQDKYFSTTAFDQLASVAGLKSVPEPSTLLLLGSGLIGLGVFNRKKFKK